MAQSMYINEDGKLVMNGVVFDVEALINKVEKQVEIFVSETEPSTGYKINDLWFDTVAETWYVAVNNGGELEWN